MVHRLLKLGRPSYKSRKSIASLVKIDGKWIYPPWKAYRTIVWYILVRSDTYPGLCFISEEDILRKLLCNFLLIVVGNVVNRVCETDYICGVLKTVIEGGIRHIRSMRNVYVKKMKLEIVCSLNLGIYSTRGDVVDSEIWIVVWCSLYICNISASFNFSDEMRVLKATMF